MLPYFYVLHLWFKDSSQCMVYSFGINDDWSFEDLMDSSGCTVNAFDHTVDFPSRRGTNTHFYKLGLGSSKIKRKNSARMKPLPDILKMWASSLDDYTACIVELSFYRNGHDNTTIDYLKVPPGLSSLEMSSTSDWHWGKWAGAAGELDIIWKSQKCKFVPEPHYSTLTNY